MAVRHAAGCLCGAVRFAADGPLGAVTACHCARCRRLSGHYWAAVTVPLERFHVLSDRGLAWFQPPGLARRGFCRICGASLLRMLDDRAEAECAAGAFDAATGLCLTGHRHVEQAGDYYAPEGPPPTAGSAPEILECGCLCGACRFTVPGPAGPVTACHCNQCRRLSGHYSASFDADARQMTWQAREGLGEHVSPSGGRRGFCRHCGASLWFRDAKGALSVEAGAVSGPTGGRLAAHIFLADKGDYYTIDDGLPQFVGWQD